MKAEDKDILCSLIRDHEDTVGGSRVTMMSLKAFIASIQQDVGLGGTATVRMIIDSPEELFRIEVDRPDMAYQRTTILDRDALEALLEETPEQLLRERFTFRGRP